MGKLELFEHTTVELFARDDVHRQTFGPRREVAQPTAPLPSQSPAPTRCRSHRRHLFHELFPVDKSRRSDYSDHMITNLREAKSNLSQLVQLAAKGEEVIITVRGRPMARLTCVVPKKTHDVARKEWADELSAAAEAARSGRPKSTKQQFWDELRDERM